MGPQLGSKVKAKIIELCLYKSVIPSHAYCIIMYTHIIFGPNCIGYVEADDLPYRHSYVVLWNSKTTHNNN